MIHEPYDSLIGVCTILSITKKIDNATNLKIYVSHQMYDIFQLQKY